MMAKKPSALVSIFDDEPETVVAVAAEPEQETSSAGGTAQ